jgi:uncharacterized protein
MPSISPTLLREVVRRLMVEFHPESIYLFGSHARGKPNAESDLDLLVIITKSSEKPIQRAVRAQRSLRGVKLVFMLSPIFDMAAVQLRSYQGFTVT